MGAASRLQAASSALQLAAQLSGQPQLISAELTLIQRGLETTTYVGASVRAISDLRMPPMKTLADVQSDVQAAGLTSDADIAASLAAIRRRWSELDRKLAAPAHGAGRRALYRYAVGLRAVGFRAVP